MNYVRRKVFTKTRVYRRVYWLYSFAYLWTGESRYHERTMHQLPNGRCQVNTARFVQHDDGLKQVWVWTYTSYYHYISRALSILRLFWYQVWQSITKMADEKIWIYMETRERRMVSEVAKLYGHRNEHNAGNRTILLQCQNENEKSWKCVVRSCCH
jgi:hypothetical protein